MPDPLTVNLFIQLLIILYLTDMIINCKRTNVYSILGFCVLLFVLSCKKAPSTNWSYEISGVKHSFLATYQHVILDHQQANNTFTSRVNQFYFLPIIGNFNNCRGAWKESWKKYQQLKPFFMMNGAFDNDIKYKLNNVESWLMNPGFIDSINVDPFSGIVVNETGYPAIEYAGIPLWHDPAANNYTQGYQVLEFILWGEDNSTSGGGDRQHFDFISTSTIQDRRREFLKHSAFYLNSEFNYSFTTSFEQDVLASSNEDFMNFLLSGLIDFIDDDFAENTINRPYISQDINDELSRFSENTKADIFNKALAIETLIYGGELFDSENSYFLGDFIREINPEKEQLIASSIAFLKVSANDIIGDFDSALSSASERPKILAIYQELVELSAAIRSFASDLNIVL
jgi:putative iron-regulated protein